MADGYKPPPNWGCIVVFIVGVPLLLSILLVAALNAGGCEGVMPPCHRNHAPILAVFAVALIVCFGLAWIINTLLDRFRS
jgi:hypothetical protein